MIYHARSPRSKIPNVIWLIFKVFFFQRTYINVGPYQDVNDVTMMKSNEISCESRSERTNFTLGEDGESCLHTCRVSDIKL